MQGGGFSSGPQLGHWQPGHDVASPTGACGAPEVAGMQSPVRVSLLGALLLHCPCGGKGLPLGQWGAGLRTQAEGWVQGGVLQTGCLPFMPLTASKLQGTWGTLPPTARHFPGSPAN